jgi:beta-glucanase (GH16 family)
MFTGRFNNLEADKLYGVQSGFVLNDSTYAFKSENYSLVFNDEFTGTALNSSVWFNGVTTESAREYDSSNNRNYIDNSAVSVSDGVLTLTSSTATNEKGGTDYIGADLRSRGNVEFAYGYLEIKAKLPKGPNHTASLWLPGTRTEDKPYASEVDVFETLSWENKIVPDIHVWYTTDSQLLPEWITNNKPTNVYDDQNKSEFDMSSISATEVTGINEYHIYGCEWTPTEIKLTVDGEAYATYDLTSNVVFTALAEGELLSLALGNGYYNPNDNTGTEFQGEYVIDYVRLYQTKDGRLSGSAVK